VAHEHAVARPELAASSSDRSTASATIFYRRAKWASGSVSPGATSSTLEGAVYILFRWWGFWFLYLDLSGSNLLRYAGFPRRVGAEHSEQTRTRGVKLLVLEQN
jgi:hypothetical protein